MTDEQERQKLRDKEEQVARERAILMRINYTDVRQLPPEAFNPDIMTPEQMQEFKVVPLSGNVRQLQLGFYQETPQHNLEKVQELFREYQVFFSYLSKSGFQEVYDKYYQNAHKDDPAPPSAAEVADQLATRILETNDQIRNNENLDLFTDQLDSVGQQELFRFIVQQAYLLGSSDIHIEPLTKKQTRVRFRIDGRLHPVGDLPQDKYKTLLNTMQIQAGIRWNADYPQTGSTKMTLVNQDKENIDVNMRLESIPTIHGTDIVIRIFNMEEQYLSLENLGLSGPQRQNLEELITHPHGLVLMVGPTGSGKTSTQYAILNQLNTPDVKIVTLEDPVEYELQGITQVPVRSDDKESFIDRLRAVMREDPDIIMLGEIRDADTARTALQASLTGHLVLSTFHASTAAAAISRLADTIEQNPLLASALRLIMAQRLVRRLCEHCKEAYQPDSSTAELVKQTLRGITELSEPVTLYRAVGCEQCHHIGYQGRLVILEQLKVTDTMESVITNSEDVTTRTIHDQAVSEGMVTLMQDGFQKALAGHTSLEEVFRVVEV